MFHLLATTKCKRQQIAILIISFFAYVAGIRNEGSNMLLQQELLQQQQQQPTILGISDNKRPITDASLNFRPSQIIDFTPADAVRPQFRAIYMAAPHPTSIDKAIQYNYNKNIHNVSQTQETEGSNRRYAIQMTATHGAAAEKPFSFPNEQQQIPQHLTDKPIYVYRDPFRNENYHYTPTETNVKETITPTTYNHNNYNYDAYKQQNLHQHLQQYDDNQEYLVQSSMTVGTHQQQQEINPLRPYMSLSADKDVYLKRPGLVYDEKPSHNHPNSAIDKKSEVNKISYDSHDYPPPTYFQQQTSNFLPTPVPAKPPTPAPIVRPTAPPRYSSYQHLKAPQPPNSAIFVQQLQPQPQYSQSSQSTLPNYANSIDNYLLNKQQTSEFYRTETPPPPPPYSQRPQHPYQHENRPPLLEYDFPQQTASHSNEHSQQQHFYQPPPYNSAQIPNRQYEPARPPPGHPSYNNYYGYQIGEIPPQSFNYPYPRPPTSQYPYQGPYRPPAPPSAQPSGLATLAQYAPQFTSLLLGGVGSGGANSHNNGPLGSLIGALTGAATSQQSSYPSSSAAFNRRPLNSQLIKALENIARNDDLQCVPKVLCQMIAAQTQRGQLPTFITSPAITNFLAGFPAASPALIYGRAALLGLSGGDRSCHQTYVKCPKDEYEIIYYLNNHRGGFFKFFSEPEEQQQTVNHVSAQQGSTSLFSILSALTGAPQTTTTTARPTPKPQAPATDITSGIGNFFTQLLSDYVGSAAVEYQRRFKRRTKRALDDKVKFEGQSGQNPIKFADDTLGSQRDVLTFKDQQFESESKESLPENEDDFHDEEDEEDTQYSLGFENSKPDYLDSTESRILHKDLEKGKRILFFPEMTKEDMEEVNIDEELKQKIKKYNDSNKERKLKFPTDTDERMYTEVSTEKLRKSKYLHEGAYPEDQNYVENSFDDNEKAQQKVKFIDYHEEEHSEKQDQHLHTNYLKDHESSNTNIFFPQRGGKILNNFHYAPSYLQSYPNDQQNQKAEAEQYNEFVLPNVQTSLHYTKRPASAAFNFHNTYTNSLKTQNVLYPNKAIDNNIYVASPTTNTNTNHFLPTPPPLEYEFSSSNAISSTQNYSKDQRKPSSDFKYPSEGSSSALHFNNNSIRKPIQPYFSRYHSSLYTTKRPHTSQTTTEKSDNKNIYVTNSRGVTEYYITPDGRKVYL